ncbi:MAG TPA: uroporphyrinogen-III synthase [Acidimicrobiales bacterium]|nr:uroporphyrinogen-III synthase [Acidimicrobiales bacterium]
MTDLPLAGRAVGVTADRRGDDQVVMFERLGAAVVLGPTLSTVKVPDPELLRRRTAELVADPPDFLIADTGIGMRTWFEAADGWGQKDALVEAMRRSRIAARGPKAAGALSSAGLSAWWRSPTEQLGDLVEHLIATGVEGRTVTFQLHGDDGAEVVSRLASAGATVTTIPVYVWQPPADPAPARDLIERIRAGGIDAVTFTAGPQIRSLVDLAGPDAGDLVRALNQMVVGCIGPVCAGVAQDCGIGRPVVPGAWRLGSLVRVVTEALVG